MKSRLFFWLGIALCMLFIALTDVRMLASPYPYLYGITDTFHSRFEESILYTPFVSNFSWQHFFQIDYSGANTQEGLAPYPYFAIFILGLVDTLTGHHINLTILLLHSLILVEFGLVYALSRRLGAKDSLASIIALFTVFDTITIPLFGVSCIIFSLMVGASCIGWKKHRYIILLVGAGLVGGFGFLKYISPQIIVLQRWVNDLLNLKLSTLAALQNVWANLPAGTYYADLYSTRFISPLLPMIVLFASLLVLVVSWQHLKSQTRLPLWQWLLGILVLGLNVYTYYANCLIIAPLFIYWFISLRHQLWAQRTHVAIALGLGLIFIMPFGYAFILSKMDPAYSEFAYRAAARGIKEYVSNNYRLMNAEYWLLWFGLLLASVLGYWKRKITDVGLLPLIALSSVILWFHFNYFVADFVPQAYLLQRYFVPLLLLSLVPLATLLMDNFTTNRAQTIGFIWLSGLFSVASVSVLVLAIGRYNTHRDFSGPAMQPLAKDLIFAEPYVNTNTILVSNIQPLNILAPGILGVRTFMPNPISTLGTHHSFAEQYAIQSKLLNYDYERYLALIGDIDQFGVVHVRQNNSPFGVNLYTQTQGLAYPLPSDWIQQNQTTLKNIYQDTSMTSISQRYHHIQLYLIDQPLPKKLEPYFTLIASDGTRSLYQQLP